MAKPTLTPKQQEVADLINAQPNMSAKEIADVLESTEGAIYQHIKKLRQLKVIPQKRDPAPTPRAREDQATFDRMIPPVAEFSIEQRLEDELGNSATRLSEISAEQGRLREEELKLRERVERLGRAKQALSADNPVSFVSTEQPNLQGELAAASS